MPEPQKDPSEVSEHGPEQRAGTSIQEDNINIEVHTTKTDAKKGRRASSVMNEQPDDPSSPTENQGWGLMTDMSTGLYEVLFKSEARPPISSSGVKFRHHPVKWLQGLNFRSTRMAIGVYTESHLVQLAMLVLIIVDVAAVFGELLMHNLCHHDHTVEATTHILRIVSLTALSVFLFQQLLLIYAYGAHFFMKPMYVLDFVIVLGSIILETALSDPSGGLLVVLMLWRGVRVVHGFAVSLETEQHAVDKYREKSERLRTMLTNIFSYEFTMFRVHNMKQAARRIQYAYLQHLVRNKREEKHAILRNAQLDPDIASDEAEKQLPEEDAKRYSELRRQIHTATERIDRMKLGLPLFNLAVAIQREEDTFELQSKRRFEEEEDATGIETEGSIKRSESMVDLVMNKWHQDDFE
eukprot:gb/GECG01006673.1/.p1 GENE.gb/GECG01006673.1/~~gb/GECG01006673.1/.p1  ORF type:complete len:410 (+),score=51.09 gb/GECG01006673.1/:1-1230(+)